MFRDTHGRYKIFHPDTRFTPALWKRKQHQSIYTSLQYKGPRNKERTINGPRANVVKVKYIAYRLVGNEIAARFSDALTTIIIRVDRPTLQLSRIRRKRHARIFTRRARAIAIFIN